MKFRESYGGLKSATKMRGGYSRGGSYITGVNTTRTC